MLHGLGGTDREVLHVTPTRLQTAWASGASRSHSLSPPHSSPSKWLKPIQRIFVGSITWATCSRTSSNIER